MIILGIYSECIRVDTLEWSYMNVLLNYITLHVGQTMKLLFHDLKLED